MASLATCIAPAESKITDLRESLAQKLPDIEQVDRIVSEYTVLKQRAKLDEKAANILKEWLVAKSLFIGSAYYDHNLLFKKASKLAHNDKFKRHYKKFVDAITTDDSSTWSQDQLATTKKVTILFTGAYGGGHKAPAMALNKYLTEKGHTVQLIDVDEVENRYSPQIDGYTKADIYAEVYQKQNDPEKAKELTRLINEAQRVEDKKYLTDIRQSLTEFKPDHILAVAHHKPKLSYLSYKLGIPMTYIHTDHGFNKTLLPILYEQQNIDYPLITFAMLDSKDSVYKKSPSIVRQLVRVDFPVRASFVPTSKQEQLKLKKELNVPRGAIVIKLAMGQNGLANDMKRILNRLIRERSKLKTELHVFAICGKNEALKNDLARYAKKKGKVRVHVMGFLDEQEMARIDRASDVWITKPGGSTSSELLETQKQMLYEINPAHPWEQNNADFLKSFGLAKKLAPKKAFVKQILGRIKADKKVKKKRLPRSSWQAQIDELLKV